MTGRQRFECTKCGVRISGRVGRDGLIFAYDRGPDSDGPIEPCVCIHCARAIADGGK